MPTHSYHGIRSYLVVAGLSVLVASCNSRVATAPSPTLESLAISGVGSTVTVGDAAPLAATATYSDDSTLAVTSQAVWQSSNTAVAIISVSGIAAFVAAGDADLRATYKGMSSSIHVSVVPPGPTVTAIAIKGIGDTATAGNTVSLRAVATFSDGATVDVTNDAKWDSSDTSVATITSTGTVTFVAGGVVNLRATYHDASALVQVAVSVPPPPPPPPPDVSQFYGTFNVSLSVTGQSCVPPVVMAPNATLVLAGNPDGSNLSAVLTERGVARPYSGRMGPDGSFFGFFSGLVPGLAGATIIYKHTADGSIGGMVVGRNVSGGEFLTFHDSICAGGTLTTAFSGSK